MIKLEIKHYFLFFLSFFILFIAEIPAGSLILLFAWGQMAIYLWRKQLTRQIQIQALVHSIVLFPIFLFLGSILSFSIIYFKENNFNFFLSSFLVSFIVSYFALAYHIGFYLFQNNDTSLFAIYSKIFKSIKLYKFYFLKISLIFLGATFLSKLLPIDYAIVVGLIIAHFMGKTLAQKLPPEIVTDQDSQSK